MRGVMFLRHTKRKKDGKEHRYWSIVENRRVGGGRVVQRPLLYLGEINDSQELAWRKSIAVIEEGAAAPRPLSLFPEDRCEGVLPDAAVVRLKLAELRLCRPRQWGGCWLAVNLWRELALDRFWAERLDPSRKGTRWHQVLLPLATYRLLAPGSEWRLHRQWFEGSAMADLLGEDVGLAEIHKLYRCHDRLLEHKQALFDHLVGRWRDLFNVSFDVLLYALSHQVKRCLRRCSSACSHHLLLRERRVKFVGREWTRLFRVAACRVCRLLPAPFDGLLDDRTIVGLA